MRIDWDSIRARFRHWELYTFHFINYIFHSEEGKRVRGRFIRRVLFRTFIYALWGLPAFGLLYVLGWVSFNSFGSIFGFVFLDVDVAVGVALIKTVGEYRYRIELIYRVDPEETDNPDVMPMGHREMAPVAPVKAKKEQPVEASEYLSMLMDSSAPPPEAAPEEPADDGPEPDGKLVLECTECKKRIHPSDRETARRMERCIYCGGGLKKIYE